MNTALNLTPRERDTLLAALRWWQKRPVDPTDPKAFPAIEIESVIACEHGKALTNQEIDALCDRLNR